MKKGTFKVLQRIHLKKGYENQLKELEGTFEIHGVLMIHKTAQQKKYSISHIKTGGAYIHSLTLKEARTLTKMVKDYTCWKAKDYEELERKCHSRRWKGKLEKAILKALETV